MQAFKLLKNWAKYIILLPHIPQDLHIMYIYTNGIFMQESYAPQRALMQNRLMHYCI